MPLIPSGFFLAQAEFQTEGPSDPVMVVTGHQRSFGLDADANAALVASNAWGNAGSLLTMMADTVSLVRVKTYLNPGTGVLEIGEWNGSLGGAQTGEAVPPQVAVLIQKQSGLAGRRNRGRMYVPGAEQGVVGADGIINTAALGNWQSAATAFWQHCVDNDIDLAIFHESPPDTATVVTGLSVQAVVATQRRRVR